MDNRNIHTLASKLPPDAEVDAWVQKLLEDSTPQQQGQPAPQPTRRSLQIIPFTLDGVAPSVVAAHKAVKDWLRAQVNRQQPYNLTLLGPSGCGKTHLATNARAFILTQRRQHCVLRSWPRILSELKAGDAENIKHQIALLPVLVIDDLGAEDMGAEWTRERSASHLWDILDRRQRKWTMITSNLSLEAMNEKYDSRVASRLCRNGAVVIEMQDAEDYALRMFKANSHQQERRPNE